MSDSNSDILWRSPRRDGTDKWKFARFLDKKSLFGVGFYCGHENFGGMILSFANNGISYIYCEVADIPEDCKEFGFIWQNRNYRVYVGETGNASNWRVTVQHREPDTSKEHMLSDIYGRCVTIKWDEQAKCWVPSLEKFQELFWEDVGELQITSGRLCKALDSGKVVIRDFEPNRLSEVEKEFV